VLKAGFVLHGRGEVKEKPPEKDWILTIGGDGTILRTAQAVAPYAIPILGINMVK